MNNLTKKISGVTLGLMMVGAVQADTFNATATVSSSITLVETTPLDLGTLFLPTTPANCANGDESTLTISSVGAAAVIAAGANNCANADFISLAPDTPGVVTVTGAAAFGTVTVTSGTPVALTHASANPALPTIEFTSVVTAPTTGNTITLDANGDGSIVVGGVFTLEDSVANAALTAYADGIYTGTYDINVSY